MIRTDQAVFLGKSDVAAIVGKLGTIRGIALSNAPAAITSAVAEILAIIEHAQGGDESAIYNHAMEVKP